MTFFSNVDYTKISILHSMSYVEWLNTDPCAHEIEELENIWNSSNSMWLMVGSIMQQGCDILPRY